jgi:acyl-homoserine-lactone acylase
MTLPPLNPADYPPYLAPTTINTREQRGLEMLTTHDQMTFEQLIEAKHSTYSRVADQLLPDLLRAARAADSELMHQAADVLEQWDREFEAGSRGALLFNSWFTTYLQQAIAQATAADPTFHMGIDVLVSDLIYATPFDPQAPLKTPAGLANEALAMAALETAVQQLQSQGLALDAPWGEVARLRRGNYDLPDNGNDGTLGVFRVIIYAPAPDGKLQSIAGDSHVAVVEFSDPLQAQVLLTYGNATQANAFDVGDQLQLAAKKQLRPAWRTRAEVEANLASRETFSSSTTAALTQ